MARGVGVVSDCALSPHTKARRDEMPARRHRPKNGKREGGRGVEGQARVTYIPLRLEHLDAHKGPRHRLVGQDRLVLLERPLADLGVVRLWDGILQESLLQLVERHYDAKDLGERVLQVPLGAGVCELHLLRDANGEFICSQLRRMGQFRGGGVRMYSCTSSRFIVAESAVFGT